MKCLICNIELEKGAKKCPKCGLLVGEHTEDELKKDAMFSNKKELDEDKYHTIVLLRNQLDSIRELLDEDEREESPNNKEAEKNKSTQNKEVKNKKSSSKKKSNKKKVNKKSVDNDVLSSINLSDDVTKEELVRDIEQVSKELEEVTKDIEKTQEYIDLVQREEKENHHSIEEKILMTAPIDKLADAIVGEIVEGIKTNREDDKHIELELKDKDKNDIHSELNKTKEYEFELGKTIAISTLEDTKEFGGSLMDDINRQIEDINNEVASEDDVVVKVEDVDDIVEEPIAKKTIVEEQVETLSTRKKILFFTGIAVLFLVFTVMGLWCFTKLNHKDNEAKVNYIDQMNVAMQTYYKTDEIDDILYILEDIKNDKEKVKKLQAKTRTICDSWVLLYLNEEVENKENFEKATSKYKNLLEGLYRYAIVKTDTNLVRALTEKDYNDLLIQFDNIYSDSAVFYDALELYNAKDYNKAYYMFSRIESVNSYYDKSVSYSNLIISNILDTMKKDISKLEANSETLDNAGKLEMYSKIEQIVIDYNSVYSNIDLTQNEEYQKLLSKYTSKVSEYTDKVLNDFNSQGSVT